MVTLANTDIKINDSNTDETKDEELGVSLNRNSNDEVNGHCVKMIHRIFGIRRVFVNVELSNLIQLIYIYQIIDSVV